MKTPIKKIVAMLAVFDKLSLDCNLAVSGKRKKGKTKKKKKVETVYHNDTNLEKSIEMCNTLKKTQKGQTKPKPQPKSKQKSPVK